MFSAVLDTNVLWPSLQRDFLLSMAALGLYRPLWSEAILEELHEHEQIKMIGRGVQRPDALARADHLIEQMRAAFDDAVVTGWEPLEGAFGLDDADDEHVVAAAVTGGAGVIVTDNLKDFPVGKIPAHIEVQSAKEFAVNTTSVNPELAARAIVEISTRHRLPPESPDAILDVLVRTYGMAEVGELIRPLICSSGDVS